VFHRRARSGGPSLPSDPAFVGRRIEKPTIHSHGGIGFVKENAMRPGLFGVLLLAVLLAGCGHSSSGTLTVSCNGQTALVGARSIDILVDPRSKKTTLSFADPINDDQTATIAVDQRCSVKPTP
jgi:hypothetical protein